MYNPGFKARAKAKTSADAKVISFVSATQVQIYLSICWTLMTVVVVGSLYFAIDQIITEHEIPYIILNSGFIIYSLI